MPCASIGFEMAPNAVKIAQAAGLRVKQGVVDKLDESFVGQHFDVIRLIDILEHTTNPGSVIKQIHSLLNSNGECIICVPNYNAFSRRLLGQYWPVFHLPFHRFHFNYHSLKMILEKNGFVVKFCISKNTLQLLYGIEYFVHHKRIKIPIVNIFTRILFTPLDFFFDCCFPRWGDSIEIHAIRKS
jgi:2-polyprenyl-3-methyl-5-hydroxy-6-metoxy-1,4-benzoquinol methylase